ncbi:MAG TPA: hypothetical protein DCM62_10765 [Bacteroidales bacterium]|nr:hypothetical protein [Bacteroidales bacterium]
MRCVHRLIVRKILIRKRVSLVVIVSFWYGFIWVCEISIKLKNGKILFFAHLEFVVFVRFPMFGLKK